MEIAQDVRVAQSSVDFEIFGDGSPIETILGTMDLQSVDNLGLKAPPQLAELEIMGPSAESYNEISFQFGAEGIMSKEWSEFWGQFAKEPEPVTERTFQRNSTGIKGY